MLGLGPPWLDDVVRAKRPERLLVVLPRDEADALLDALDGIPRLMAPLLCASGLRLLECAQLRIKDVDLERRTRVPIREECTRDCTAMPLSHQQSEGPAPPVRNLQRAGRVAASSRQIAARSV